MKKIILLKQKEKFSYIKYFLFTYFKKYSLYDKYIEKDIFKIPCKKRLKRAYLKALCQFLKNKNITHILTFDEEIKEALRNNFSIIIGKNIYRTIFLDILNFLSENMLYEYEVIFISDNIKEIKELMEKCAKSVKNVSVLTQKPYLFESLKDLMLSKYGMTLNIRTKKEKLKKNHKIYVNTGANRIFEKSMFKNVNMIDIYNVYEGAYNEIILCATPEVKEYTKQLKCPYLLPLAEFLYGEKKDKNLKIVNIKK